MKRFLSLASRASSILGSSFSETPALMRKGGTTNLDESIPALENYIWEVAKVAAMNTVALMSSGALVPRKGLLE